MRDRAGLLSHHSDGLGPVADATLGAACGLACVASTGPVRWLAGTLLVAYLPGRATRLALRWRPSGFVLAGALDIALSLCFVVLAGVAISGTSRGIRLSTMLMVLVPTTTLLPLTALRRRSPRDRPKDRRTPAVSLKAIAIPTAAFLTLAAVALALATKSADSTDTSVKTTDLSIMPIRPGTAKVTVTNWEHAYERYRLIVTRPGNSPLLLHFALPPGGTYAISVSTATLQAPRRLTASLYSGSSHPPQWQVWLTASDAER